ncbi:MAG: M36 family metallopeptidase, partial [Bacteroidota bacterium]
MRIRTALPALLLALCLAVPAAAQESAAVLAAKSHFRTLVGNSLVASDLSDLHATDAHFDRATGATYVYLTQRHDGIEVWGAIAPAAVLPNGKVHALAPRRYEFDLARRVNTAEAALDGGSARALAESHLRAVAPATPRLMVRSDEPGETLPTAEPVVFEPSEARLVYQPMEDGALRLAWAMELISTTGDQMWNVRVDAQTGSILAVDDLVVRHTWPTTASEPSLAPLAPEAHAHSHAHAHHDHGAAAQAGNYRVVAWPAESPIHGDYTLVADPEDDTASPLGWHDTGTQQFTITRGNNAWAFLDRDDNNSPDPNGEPDGGASLTFDDAYDFSQEPVDNVAATVTNLFYWGNVFHDILYHYGFDEASGNFQTNNFGNG